MDFSNNQALRFWVLSCALANAAGKSYKMKLFSTNCSAFHWDWHSSECWPRIQILCSWILENITKFEPRTIFFSSNKASFWRPQNQTERKKNGARVPKLFALFRTLCCKVGTVWQKMSAFFRKAIYCIFVKETYPAMKNRNLMVNNGMLNTFVWCFKIQSFHQIALII